MLDPHDGPAARRRWPEPASPARRARDAAVRRLCRPRPARRRAPATVVAAALRSDIARICRARPVRAPARAAAATATPPCTRCGSASGGCAATCGPSRRCSTPPGPAAAGRAGLAGRRARRRPGRRGAAGPAAPAPPRPIRWRRSTPPPWPASTPTLAGRHEDGAGRPGRGDALPRYVALLDRCSTRPPRRRLTGAPAAGRPRAAAAGAQAVAGSLRGRRGPALHPGPARRRVARGAQAGQAGPVRGRRGRRGRRRRPPPRSRRALGQGAEAPRRAPGRGDRRRHLAGDRQSPIPTTTRWRSPPAGCTNASGPPSAGRGPASRTRGRPPTKENGHRMAEREHGRPRRGRRRVAYRPRTASRSRWCTGPGTTTGRCPRASSTPASTCSRRPCGRSARRPASHAVPAGAPAHDPLPDRRSRAWRRSSTSGRCGPRPGPTGRPTTRSTRCAGCRRCGAGAAELRARPRVW